MSPVPLDAEEPAHDRVGEQAPLPGEPHLPVSDRRRPVDQAVGHEAGYRRPARRLEAAHRDASRQPGAEQHPLVVALLVGEHLPSGGRRLPRGEARRIRRGVLDVPPPHSADVAVGAWADAPPVAAAPVPLVVAAPQLRRPRPVAHLVPLVARGGEHLVGQLVLVGLVIVLGRRDLPATDLDGEPGPLLDDQGVGGDVVGLEGDGGVEAAPPVVQRLPRRAVDEVEADVESRAPGPADGAGDVGRVVGPVEGPQHVGHRALHPEADPGEAAVRQRDEGLG